MDYNLLSQTVSIKRVSEDAYKGVFEISGLYTGYGETIGNALRRTLLSSLPGGAVTLVKIKGVKHEFSTIPGVAEDVVDVILNLKRIRFAIHSDEPQVLTLNVKGEKKVTAGDIKGNADVEVVNPELVIATLTAKSAEIDMELTVEKGLGYLPVELRKTEKTPIGSIALDAIFTPIIAVNFETENMRVGDKTDYNKVTLTIETDGTVSPSRALHKAVNILKDHVEAISQFDVKEDFSNSPVKARAKKEEKKSKEEKEEKGTKAKTAKKAKK